MMETDKKVQIEQWGYRCGSEQEASALVWPVRFKPGLTLICVVVGLVAQWPMFLIVVGALGLMGTLFQRLSWIDALYNGIACRLFKTPRLGPDPAPRRWLCGMADAFVLFSGLALQAHRTVLAWIFGGMVIALAGSVVLTGICLPAFLWYRVRKRS